MKCFFGILATLYLFSIVPSVLSGQTTLAEAKKKEEERRKKTEESKIKLDSSNIKASGESGNASGFMQGNASAPPSPSEHKVIRSNGKPGTSKIGNESRWRSRAKAHQRKIENLKKKIEYDEQMLNKAKRTPVAGRKINSQEGIIYNCQNRLQIDRENLAKAEREYQNFKQEARKAGIPPGWLRD